MSADGLGDVSVSGLSKFDGNDFIILGIVLGVGGAMLSKGPPGLAALVAAVVASWLAGGRPALRSLRPAVGAFMLVLLALPWIVPYTVAARPVFVHDVLVGEYAHWFFKPQGLGSRIASPLSVLLYFLPWTLFLPAAAAWWRWSDPDDGRRYVLWWTVTLWILVGLSGKYRARYYLPVYPGLAILTGGFFAGATARVVRRELQFGSIAFVILSMVILLAMVFPPSFSGEGPVYMPDTVRERVLIACLAVAGAVGAVFTLRRDRLLGLAGVVAIVLGAIFTVEGLTSPARRARYYDVPTLGAVATAHTPPDGVRLPGLVARIRCLRAPAYRRDRLRGARPPARQAIVQSMYSMPSRGTTSFLNALRAIRFSLVSLL